MSDAPVITIETRSGPIAAGNVTSWPATERQFRDAWVANGDVITVDMPAAREIARAEIRRARTPAFLSSTRITCERWKRTSIRRPSWMRKTSSATPPPIRGSMRRPTTPRSPPSSMPSSSRSRRSRSSRKTPAANPISPVRHERSALVHALAVHGGDRRAGAVRHHRDVDAVIERIMDGITHAVGHWATIPVCVVAVGTLYMLFGVEVANFSISVATLLILPVIQHSQNKDGAAIQAKLDSIVKAVPDAPNELIRVKKKTEDEIRGLRDAL